jgi:15-cis-phytoene synthase
MVAKDANLPNAAIVREEARNLDHDRYLAALLAPAPARDALMTVAAFHGEIARVPTSVREPAMGAIRLQWWRDALGGDTAAEPTGSPIVERLRPAIESGALPIAEVISIIDAYETLLQPGTLADAAALDAFLDASQGAAFRLSARILGAEDGEAREIVGAAAQAYGRVQLLRALPLLLAKGHNPFAPEPIQDWAPVVQPILADTRKSLGEVRRLMPVASLTLRTAILPVALVEPYLAALERLGSRIASEQAEISPLSRVWRIYVARRRGRL